MQMIHYPKKYPKSKVLAKYCIWFCVNIYYMFKPAISKPEA